MPVKCIVMGGKGLVGSSLVSKLISNGIHVISIDKGNYKEYIGESCDLFINANGNTFRYKANSQPLWDYNYSVNSVVNSFNDFKCIKYIYISTIDVYNNPYETKFNIEDVYIDSTKLDYYGFHKWLSETLVKKYCTNSIILRLGSVLGKHMKKGPIYDLLNNNKLYMSKSSKLTFIDTDSIANVILLLMLKQTNGEIFNVSGTGNINVGELMDKFTFNNQIDTKSSNNIYRYNINTKKINKLIKIESTVNIVDRFIRSMNS
jgi:nucleoside-diphosphate-sugar epimerase